MDRSLKPDWNVVYGTVTRNPLDKKLDSLDELMCFHVQFFGGTVDIIGREIQVGGK